MRKLNRMIKDQIQATAICDKEQRQSLEEKEQEVNYLITNRHVACRGGFDNVLCFIKNNSEEAHLYYVVRCQYKQLEKHLGNGLDFITQTWRWLTNAMTQTEFIDGVDSSVN